MVGSIPDGSTTKDIFGGPTHFRVLVLVHLGRPVDQKMCDVRLGEGCTQRADPLVLLP
jgi:hypothetical protein